MFFYTTIFTMESCFLRRGCEITRERSAEGISLKVTHQMSGNRRAKRQVQGLKQMATKQTLKQVTDSRWGYGYYLRTSWVSQAVKSRDGTSDSDNLSSKIGSKLDHGTPGFWVYCALQFILRLKLPNSFLGKWWRIESSMIWSTRMSVRNLTS